MHPLRGWLAPLAGPRPVLRRRLLGWLLLWGHLPVVARPPLGGRALLATAHPLGASPLLRGLAAHLLTGRLGLRRGAAALWLVAVAALLFWVPVRATSIDVLVHGYTCR